MDGMSFLIDTSRCTGCRACQVACKSWNMNAAGRSANLGGHQNPADLDGETFKLVRFSEQAGPDPAAPPAWYFFSDQCRHCLAPDCKDAIEGYVTGGVVQDAATGAVLYTEKASKAVFEDVRYICPYDIPRQDAGGRLVKCTMCIDRVHNGLAPACVAACSSGAMQFGPRGEILERGRRRVLALRSSHPAARLLDEDAVRTIFLVVDVPGRYHKHAAADTTRGMDRKLALRRLVRLALREAKNAWYG